MAVNQLYCKLRKKNTLSVEMKADGRKAGRKTLAGIFNDHVTDLNL
jgi:hypothetical protein